MIESAAPYVPGNEEGSWKEKEEDWMEGLIATLNFLPGDMWARMEVFAAG